MERPDKLKTIQHMLVYLSSIRKTGFIYLEITMASSNSGETMFHNLEQLADNPYPGRGIIQGLNNAANLGIQVYWLTGRSESSRARVLVNEVDPTSQQRSQLLRTAPFNLPEGTDTSLIIYNAMRSFGDRHVVSNGDQTDTVIKYLKYGEVFDVAFVVDVALSTRDYEPDVPNFTPRISGVIDFSSDLKSGNPESWLSVISKSRTSNLATRELYSYDLDPKTAGIGKGVHTYTGDGTPLPSFRGNPLDLPLGETIEEIAKTYWSALNPDNRVALAVKSIDIKTGKEDYTIINAHEDTEPKLAT